MARLDDEPLCPALFQIHPQRVNQVVGRLGLLIGRCGLRVENVKANVPLDHLSHQSVHRTSASGNVMQHLGALGFLVDGSFDGLNLASDSSYAIEQFLFLFCRVSHKKPTRALTSIPRRVYPDQGLRFATQQF